MNIFKPRKPPPAEAKAPCVHQFDEHTRFKAHPMTDDHILRVVYATSQKCLLCSVEILKEKWELVDDYEEGEPVEHNGGFKGAPYIKQFYWQ